MSAFFRNVIAAICAFFAAVAVVAAIVPASASGQATVVTICHAVQGDQFLQIIVPVGDAQIAVHEGHAGDVIQEGNVPCPSVPPANGEDADLGPPPVEDCPTCLPREAARTPGSGDGGGELATETAPAPAPADPSAAGGSQGETVLAQAPAAAEAPLPKTGTSVAPLLALATAFMLLGLLVRIPSRRLRRNPY